MLAPLVATHATSTSPAIVPEGFATVSVVDAVTFAVELTEARTI